jgi:hypothetical protein
MQMIYMKKVALTVLATMLTTCAGAGSAWATAVEVAGTPKDEAVPITLSLKAGTSTILKTTNGNSVNTCTASDWGGSTANPYTGSTVTAPLSTMTFSQCTTSITVHRAGTLHISHIAGTTNGTVSSSGAEITVYSRDFELYFNCKTSTGTHLGTLTGSPSSHATLHINAVMNCGYYMPSAKWEGTFVVTNPTGLGIVEKVPPPTKLEISGIEKDEPVTITSSLKSGQSLILKTTSGISENTCSNSHVQGSTEAPGIPARVTGSLSTLTFSGCTHAVTVHKPGKLYVEHVAGTTNGTVYSEEAEVTSFSTMVGTYVNCRTNHGTHIGILTGSASDHATLHVNAVLNCGFFLPSAKWEGTYTVTSPRGLGVVDGETPDETAVEVGGVEKNEVVPLTMSFQPGTSTILKTTSGSAQNTCTNSHLAGSTSSPYRGDTVTSPVTHLTFHGCAWSVTVHKPGTLHVEHIAGTTNGTVSWSEAEVTVYSAELGQYLNCKPGEGTHLGVLTGSANSHATLNVNAVINCGFFVPSAKWEAAYTVTSPTGLGVVGV